MVLKKLLVAAGLAASPALAGNPQGYGYGGMTDTAVGISTYSPPGVDTSSAILPITITNSATVTRPVTVTHTVTVSPPACSSEGTTTIDGTTSITLTTRSTIYVSVLPSSEISTQTAQATGITGADTSTVITGTSSTLATGLGVNNATTSCESTTTTAEVNGATGSLSSTLTNALTLPTPYIWTISTAIPGTAMSTTGFGATHTSTSTVPIPTIPTSTGIRAMVDGGLLAGIISLVSLISALITL
ncbi:hypothetical protein SAMD00023353_6200500 [Rosellinia necatrix]|uniref:Uncharacterized protein n=1 Tax=Rosellinia necatrix TaxID=77044 RepID=A0A1W2TSH4_ROSNE|nr:hypothetical protein SAMD00023353_6200500 [Rosellinia necatrix]